jgi:hypothetical protein
MKQDRPLILETNPTKVDLVDLVPTLNSFGHHIPLSLLASLHCKTRICNDNYQTYKYIRFEPFENLIGKRLFGIQPMEGCAACMFPTKEMNDEDITEHNTVSDILEKCFHVDFFSPQEKYNLDKRSIIEFAEDYLYYSAKKNYPMLRVITNNLIGISDSINAGLHPRMWLFVGDSVVTFETYLLFNSDHGNPYMDNWYLVNWKLSQPPANDKFKMIGQNILTINVHDTQHNSVASFCVKAHYNEWMKYCGKSDQDCSVPDEKYYPILEIDTGIKKIELGTKWYLCHYPVAICICE